MKLGPWTLIFAIFLSAAFLPAECVNDYRSNKNAGILVTSRGRRSIGSAMNSVMKINQSIF